MSKRWEWKPGYECDGSDDYYYLFAPNGTEVAALTEPEDRVPYRDLSPVTDALNRLQTGDNHAREWAERASGLLETAKRGDMQTFWKLINEMAEYHQQVTA